MLEDGGAQVRLKMSDESFRFVVCRTGHLVWEVKNAVVTRKMVKTLSTFLWILGC